MHGRLLPLAFLPLAAILRSTDGVAAHAGPAPGGLLTISFGSTAELLLAFC